MLSPLDQGWYRDTGVHFPTNSNFLVGRCCLESTSFADHRNWFLFDMSETGGLWRVASFLFLGLSLFLLSMIYTRFVKGAGGPKPGQGQGQAELQSP